MTPIERFWSKIDKRGPDECWLWIGGKIPGGYGRIHIGSRSTSAHRFSYELANGPIPWGIYICHRCDVPSCVNPAHLFAGTHTENMKDMLKKGRKPRGQQSSSAKLTESDVILIRQLYAAGGVTQKALGLRFGVDMGTINGIVKGRFWKHLL